MKFYIRCIFYLDHTKFTWKSWSTGVIYLSDIQSILTPCLFERNRKGYREERPRIEIRASHLWRLFCFVLSGSGVLRAFTTCSCSEVIRPSISAMNAQILICVVRPSGRSSRQCARILIQTMNSSDYLELRLNPSRRYWDGRPNWPHNNSAVSYLHHCRSANPKFRHIPS